MYTKIKSARRTKLLLPVIFVLVLLASTFTFLNTQVSTVSAAPIDQCNFIDPSLDAYESCQRFAIESIDACNETYGEDTSDEDRVFCEQRVTTEILQRFVGRDAPDYKTFTEYGTLGEFCDVFPDISSYENCLNRAIELRNECNDRYAEGSQDREYCYDRALETTYIERICTTCDGLRYHETDVYGTTADSGGPGFEGGGEAQQNQSCESAGGVFSFIMCPLLAQASDGIGWIDEQIMKALDVEQEYYQNEEVTGAWRNFRNIAYILLIPIMLVMVIGTALNFNFLDAYTVKRSLPRLFAAIIFITLSFEITTFMVEVFNVIGRGTAGLIASPFGGLDALSLENIFEAGNAGDVAFGGIAILAGVTFAALSGVTIGSLLITVLLAVLAIFIVFFLLILREMLIVFLIVLAPIAIVAWIFPGNDKPWKLWWLAFSKMLYFYPIVLGIIVMGRAFASIVDFTDAGGVVITIIKLIAFVGPYFFIPKAFQFAGGALGNLAGMVNDRSKGVFDRGRKAREGMKAEQRQQIKSGGGGVFGVGKNTAAGKWMGRRGASAYGLGRSVKNNGLIGGLRGSSITAATNKNVSEAAHEFEDKNPDFKAFSADDTVLAAAEAGNSVNDIRDALMASGDQRFMGDNGKKIATETAQLVMQAKNQMGEKAYKKAALVAKAKTGTYYRDFAHMAEEINNVYGDDRQAAGGALMEMRGASMNAGRVDLGGFGAGAGLTNLQAMYDGQKYDSKANGGKGGFTKWDRNNAQKAVTNNILDSQPASTLVHPSMKGKYLEDNIIPVMQERMQAAFDSGDHDAYMRELANAENLHQALKSTKPELVGMFGDKVMAYDVGARRVVTSQEEHAAQASGAGLQQGQAGPAMPGAGTVRRGTHQYSSDPRYQDYSRQFQSAEDALRQQQFAAQQGQGGPNTPISTPPGGSIGGGSFS